MVTGKYGKQDFYFEEQIQVEKANLYANGCGYCLPVARNLGANGGCDKNVGATAPR